MIPSPLLNVRFAVLTFIDIGNGPAFRQTHERFGYQELREPLSWISYNGILLPATDLAIRNLNQATNTIRLQIRDT